MAGCGAGTSAAVADRNVQVTVPGVPAESSHVGTVLEATAGSGAQYYVITKNGPASISEFGALLLKQQNGGQDKTFHIAIPSNKQTFPLPADWPTGVPKQVNTMDGDSPRDVSCSVMHGAATRTDGPTPGVWAGKDFPEQIVEGAASAYVTPGNGLLYQEVVGHDVSGGTLYLVTDTGLRYPVPRNNDSAAANKASNSQQQANQAATRLGYGDVKPMSIPSVWSELLPKGPALDPTSAAQPQGS